MFKTSLKLVSSGLSDIGLVRDHNEDAWYCDSEAGLFIIADGMGGHKAGEVASQIAVHRLKELIQDIDRRNHFKKYTAAELIDQLKKSVQRVNREIYQEAEENEHLKGMGTTLSCLYILDEKGFIIHVGDSRIYRFQKDSKLEPITQDHSLVTELMELGQLSIEQAENFPFKHILTRSIGTHETVEVSSYIIEVKNDDLFLLCTDGMTNYGSEGEIEDILNPLFVDSTESALSNSAKKLIDLAKEHGGGDNITVLLVKGIFSSSKAEIF